MTEFDGNEKEEIKLSVELLPLNTFIIFHMFKCTRFDKIPKNKLELKRRKKKDLICES